MLAAVAVVPRGAYARPVAGAGPGRRPTKFLQIFVSGGLDSLFLVDPKSRDEVKPRIAPVYTAQQLVESNGMRLAPNCRPLEPYLSRVSVINGILSGTVGHATGAVQTLQLRRNIRSSSDATIATLVGQALEPESPIHAFCLGRAESLWRPTAGRVVYDEFPSYELLKRFTSVVNDTHDDLGEHVIQQVEGLYRDARTREAATPVRALLQRLKGKVVPPPAVFDSSSIVFSPNLRDPSISDAAIAAFRAKGDRTLMESFQWALFLLKNNIAPSVWMSSGSYFNWDTHQQNNGRQDVNTAHLMLGLRWFLDQLAASPGTGGRTLLDEVGIVISSEIGRFPYLNAQEGKDHFPQVSAILIGPGLRAGQFGQTDAELIGLPVNLRTGRPGGSSDTILTLDDVGRTVLEWVGARAPRESGYDGRVMDFCFA